MDFFVQCPEAGAEPLQPLSNVEASAVCASWGNDFIGRLEQRQPPVQPRSFYSDKREKRISVDSSNTH